MAPVVIDASAAVEYLLRTTRGAPLVARFGSIDAPIHAPYLLVTECLHAIRGLALGRKVDPSRSALAVNVLSVWPVTYWDPRDLTARVWALRHRLSAYDATYLALAETLDAELVTGDRGLAESARQIGTVQVTGDW